MNAAYEQLIHLLDEREVRYNSSDENQSICADLRGEVGSFRIVAQVEEEVEIFQVYGYSPIRVPEGCRPSVGETVARANYGLRLGKFELDFNDGEIRFQVSQVMVADAVDKEVIDRLICVTMSMLDLYVPAFLSVIFGNERPEDAIACVEAESSHNDQDSEDEEL